MRARRCAGADDRSRGGATEEERRGGFLVIIEVAMVMGTYQVDPHENLAKTLLIGCPTAINLLAA